MKISILKVLLITMMTLPFSNLLASEGGATTVGDGGLVVECGSKVELLDLYEHKLLYGDYKITLDEKGDSVKDMVGVGLERLREKYSLDDSQYKRIKAATVAILRFPYDPWQTPIGRIYSYAIKPPSALVYSYVKDKLLLEKCKLNTVIIRPPRESKEQYAYERVCNDNFNTFEFCFFTKKSIYIKLSKPERACLVVHEAIRFLKIYDSFENEVQMRASVADICTK